MENQKRGQKKISLVTGASSGLGKFIAEKLCEKNHIVYITARREKRLQELKKHCAHLKGEMIVISGDLSDPRFRTKLISQIITKEGRIDYLINNAGFGKAAIFEKEDPEEIENMFKVNIIAYKHLTRLVLPHMQKQKSGRLIHVGSVVAFTPLPYFTSYNATKAAVYMFNRSLRYELLGPITSTVVLPARMHTGFAMNAFDCNIKKNRNLCAKEFNDAAGSAKKVANNIVRKIDSGKKVILPTFKSRLWYFMRHAEWIVDLVMKHSLGPKQLKHIKKDMEMKAKTKR